MTNRPSSKILVQPILNQFFTILLCGLPGQAEDCRQDANLTVFGQMKKGLTPLAQLKMLHFLRLP